MTEAAVLTEGTYLGTTPTTLYTVPAGKTAIIRSAIIVNVTGDAIIVNVYLVPPGGAVGPENQILRNHSLAADTVYEIPGALRQVLAAGGMIQGTAASGSAVTMRASGVTY